MSLKRLTRQEINTNFLSDFVKKWEIVLKRILEITKGIMLRGLNRNRPKNKVVVAVFGKPKSNTWLHKIFEEVLEFIFENRSYWNLVSGFVVYKRT